MQGVRIGTTTSRVISMRRSGSEVETYNGLVFWWLEPLCYSMACHDLSCNGIILAMVTILDALVRKFTVRWFLVSAQHVSR